MKEGDVLHTAPSAQGSNLRGGQNVQHNGESQVLWRVRVCPILFEDFSNLKKDFMGLIKLTRFFEYRMSQQLGTRLQSAIWTRTMEHQSIPWLPNEKTYTKPQNAATAGMVEMKVTDANLVKVITIIRTIDLSKQNRLRFELKRLSKKMTETKAGGGAEVVGSEEGETSDDDGEAKEGAMKIRFAVRLKQVKLPAFNHEADYVLQPEDKQIFLSGVPENVPDNVLQAIVMSDMLVRQKAADGSGTATFHIDSSLGAQGYMELFEGILVNDKVVGMSTSLGTLYDAKKKHADKQEENREANQKQMQGAKRKFDTPSYDAQHAKKPREDDVDQTWMRGREVARGAPGALRRGVPQGANRRAGLPGRGASGVLQGGRGAPERGVLQGWRGAPQRGGPGTVGRGATSGAFPRAGWGAPRRGSSRGRGGEGGYHDDLQARLEATQRELEQLKEEARRRDQTMEAEGGFRGRGFGPRRGFAPDRNTMERSMTLGLTPMQQALPGDGESSSSLYPRTGSQNSRCTKQTDLICRKLHMDPAGETGAPQNF